MKLLLDTHLLVWAMGDSARLGPALRELLEDPQHSLCFSVASLWELVIKAGLGREGFQVQSADPHRSCGAVAQPAAPQDSAKKVG
jgi:PIN domain nuclease of toxin-antitoxin system